MTEPTAAAAPGPFTASRNACKLCAPFGAALAFKGVRGAMTLLHGSQGCSTYIRRYMISHFREPVDIASSNFTEESAIFGGGRNLAAALANVVRQYHPEVIGVATTCLSETIGEDMPGLLREACAKCGELPPLVHVSTPSYAGTHAEGYHATLAALVNRFAEGGAPLGGVNLIAGMMSPADLRHLRALVAPFFDSCTLLPDYADPLDGPTWNEYHAVPAGGTTLDELRAMGRRCLTLDLADSAGPDSAAQILRERHGVPAITVGLPMGVRRTDLLVNQLAAASGRPIPDALHRERGRLLDSMVDAHKYCSGLRAVVFGDDDMAAGLCAFLCEAGITPVAVLSGGKSGRLDALVRAAGTPAKDALVLEGADFETLGDRVAQLRPDFFIGNSKGYMLARRTGVPLVRTGLPIHDRFGGARVLHVGYAGALSLLDRIVNTLLEHRQDESAWGYTYM